MKPIYAILWSLVLVLVGVVWYFALWSPTQEEIEDIRAQTQQELSQAQSLRTRAAQLREIRSEAAEIEARLAEVETLVPSEVRLPAILRQVELAAQDAGIELITLSPTRPTAAGDDTVPFARVDLAFNVRGTYFQLIDLARRLEDPDLMGRGVTWRFSNLSADELPVLSGALGVTVYTRAPENDAAPAPEPEPGPDAGTEDAPQVDEGSDEEIIS